MYYDKDGVKISMRRWGELSKDWKYKRIARTSIVSSSNHSEHYDVSTVWLGLDHSLGLTLGLDDVQPVIFETMVFGDDSRDLDCVRYCTEVEAKQGHTEMVVTVSATMVDPVIVDLEEE
jgi:hypothetical protein